MSDKLPSSGGSYTRTSRGKLKKVTSTDPAKPAPAPADAAPANAPSED